MSEGLTQVNSFFEVFFERFPVIQPRMNTDKHGFERKTGLFTDYFDIISQQSIMYQ